jgi:peroxiredoxin Q/BCP
MKGMARNPLLMLGAIAMLGGSLVFIAAGSGKSVLQAGDMAPSFEGLDQHGTRVRLEAFRGKSIVVLYFYPKDGTPGCTVQACSLRDGYRAIEAAGAVVIGVSADTEESHAGFAAKYHLPFSLLADPRHEIIRQYGVGMPLIGISRRVTFLIGKDGVVRQIITDARAKDHDRQVLEAIATGVTR